MKYFLLILSLAISSCIVFGQQNDTLAAYPCTINVPNTPSFIYCENGKEIKCQNFAARKSRNRIMITASKPDNSTSMFPILTLVFKSDTLLGMHKSESDRTNNYVQKKSIGNNIMYSQMQSGFAHIYIVSSDEEYIIGKFATALFNTSGNSGQLISGTFKVPYRKEQSSSNSE
jgi:hypothetical protein